MNHLVIIQSEFIKHARQWQDLTLEDQKGYLQRHPASKRKLTAVPNSKKIFTTNDGIVEYRPLTNDQKYEYIDEKDFFWNQSSKWFEINTLRVNEKFKGKGKLLLKQFIDSLPDKCGIVMNATPLDDDISFENLQAWYIKNGFKQISKNNISLYLIKNNELENLNTDINKQDDVKNRDELIRKLSPNLQDAKSLKNVPERALIQVHNSINDSLLPYGKYGQKIVKGVQSDEFIGEKIDEDTFAFYAPYKRKIVLNSTWFNKNDYDQMLSDLHEDVNEGYSPIGCDTPKAILDHEIAHGLYENLDYKNPFKQKIDEYLKTLKGQDISKNLSEYAADNKAETIAEAWSEFKNNKEPRIIAKTIGELLDNAVKWQNN